MRALILALPLLVSAATVEEHFNRATLPMSPSVWAGSAGVRPRNAWNSFAGGIGESAYTVQQFGQAQFARGIWTAHIGYPGGTQGVSIRNSSNKQYYSCELSNALMLTLIRADGGGRSTKTSASVPTAGAGDWIEATAVGAKVTCRIIARETGESRHALTWEDAAPLDGGSVGLAGSCTAASSCQNGHQIDDWIGGDLAELPAYLPVGGATTRWVAVDGLLAGDGSYGHPWPLEKVLYDAQPGWTVWIRAGTYRYFEQTGAKAAGAADAPIQYRAVPGERVIFDGASSSEASTEFFGASYTHFYGIELTSSARKSMAQPNTASPQIGNVGGWAFPTRRIGAKFINGFIHGTSGGISGDGSDEVYGTAIWNVGFDSFDRIHGGGSYSRHHDYAMGGTKLYADNLFGAVVRYGMHSWGEENSEFTWRGNAFYNGQQIAWDNAPTTNSVIENNYWSPLSGRVSLGYRYFIPGPAVRNNVFGDVQLKASSVQEFTGNRIVKGALFYPHSSDCTLGSSTIARNEYYLTTKMPVGADGGCVSSRYTFDQWQALGHDIDGAASASLPTGTWTYVRPNAYEPGRANVVIYNWDELDLVDVDLSSVLNAGDGFEISGILDPLTPILSGIYEGGSVAISMAPMPNSPWDVGNHAWNKGTGACDASVAEAEGWLSGEGAPAGACTGTATEAGAFYLDTVTARMYYCSGGVWKAEANGAACNRHTAPGSHLTEKRWGAFLVRRTYRAGEHAVLAWSGSPSDTVEAGTMSADGAYRWGHLPVHSVACSDGECTARAVRPVGDAYWRVNGGEAMKMPPGESPDLRLTPSRSTPPAGLPARRKPRP